MLKLGIYYQFYFIRQLPSIINWLNTGCASAAPHSIKMKIIRSYLRKFKLNEFIETGTYLGDTLEYIARDDVNCKSIELSEDLYLRAKKRFINYKNIILWQGDSGETLPKILENLDKPALFWLDGHFSDGITAKGSHDSPINSELEAIHNHSVSGHVILIDDARYFKGTSNYPFLDELLKEIRNRGIYQAEISTDIIRLIPISDNYPS